MKITIKTLDLIDIIEIKIIFKVKHSFLNYGNRFTPVQKGFNK